MAICTQFETNRIYPIYSFSFTLFHRRFQRRLSFSPVGSLWPIRAALKGDPAHVALEIFSQRPSSISILPFAFHSNLSLEKSPFPVPLRRFPAGIIKDILQRSIRARILLLVILAASILSLSLGRYHNTISERSWFSGCPLQAAYTPRSGLSVATTEPLSLHV